MVAVFWGANITAVYPFVQIVFQGQTLQDWADTQIESTREALDDAVANKADQAAQEAGKPGALVNAEDLRVRLQRVEKLKPYIDRYAPPDPFRTLLAIVIFLVVGTMLKAAFRISALLLVARAAGRTTANLRSAYFRSLLLDRTKKSQGMGDATARVGADMGSIGAAIKTLFGRTIQEPLKMLACLAGAAAVNWRLLIFSLLACPLASLLLLSLAKSIRRASLRAFDQKARLMGRMLQTFQGLHVVKAYNMESHERRRFLQHTMGIYREQLKITFYGSLIRANNEMLGVGVICISAVAGAYLVLNGRVDVFGVRLAANPMDFGQIMLFYAFLIGCTDPLRKLADVYGSVQGGAAAADRIMPFIQDVEKATTKSTGKRIRTLRKPITIENLQFHYVRRKPVLRGLSLRIECGETLAIVGANGSGKTTLINLLMRFLDPVRGRILLGETDLADVRAKDLRRRISLVTQRPVLFNDSVINNIRYGSRHAKFEDVVRAAKKANAHEFITKRLARGYQTNCGDGGKILSGGQQQRLTLARAILRDPEILILDEASSQIDPKSEQLIQQSLKEFVRDRTTIMITHRMSTLDLADRILVLNEGKLVDIGTHDELMSRCVLYQALRRLPLRHSA